MPASVVTLANQKGGVGKSTTTICVARAAVVAHQARVLVVDMDPSGNVTSSLARERVAHDDVSLADVLNGSETLADVIMPTVWDGVDLAPGGPMLAIADKKLAALEFGREHQLREALAAVADSYDLILIDNAPTLLGQILINSLAAAPSVVLVAEPHEWSADGLALLANTIAGVRKYHNPGLKIIGTVVNKWRGTGLQADSLAEITEGMAHHMPGVPVWTEWKIPMWTGIPDAISRGDGLDESKEAKIRVLAADTFAPLAGELLKAQAA